MKEFMKKYWTHCISYLFLITSCSLFGYLLTIGDPNADITAGGLIALIIMMLGVVGVWAVIIYEIVMAAKTKEKNKVIHCILIYMFNMIYAPCYHLKYTIKDPKYKIKNIIHYISSIILYLLMCVLMVITTIKLEVSEPINTTYTSMNNLIEITVSEEYELATNEYYQMKFDRGVEAITIGFPDDASAADNVFTNLEAAMKNESTSKFMHKENLEYKDKTVVYESYQYTYLGNGNVATVGVITFKENNKIVLFAQDSLIEEFDKEELNNIFASMKLK